MASKIALEKLLLSRDGFFVFVSSAHQLTNIPYSRSKGMHTWSIGLRQATWNFASSLVSMHAHLRTVLDSIGK
jgi:hypothetical protein